MYGCGEVSKVFIPFDTSLLFYLNKVMNFAGKGVSNFMFFPVMG